KKFFVFHSFRLSSIFFFLYSSNSWFNFSLPVDSFSLFSNSSLEAGFLVNSVFFLINSLLVPCSGNCSLTFSFPFSCSVGMICYFLDVFLKRPLSARLTRRVNNSPFSSAFSVFLSTVALSVLLSQ